MDYSPAPAPVYGGPVPNNVKYTYFVAFIGFGIPGTSQIIGNCSVSRFAPITKIEHITEMGKQILDQNRQKGWTDCIITNYILLEATLISVNPDPAASQ